jgi:hypothetical protein
MVLINGSIVNAQFVAQKLGRSRFDRITYVITYGLILAIFNCMYCAFKYKISLIHIYWNKW